MSELLDAGFWWAASVAEEIEAHQLGWWFVENYPLVAQNKLIQVRPIEQLAPAGEIGNYASLMKLGDRFPPVIATRDGWLVDGNTRTEAARRNKQDTFAAFVLNVNFSDLDPESPLYAQVTALGGAQNLKHGRRMTNAAIAALIERVSPGRTPKQIQRDLHLGSYNLANTVWNARKAKDKAKEMGIPLTGELSNSHLRMFGGKIDKLTDPVWEGAFRLVQDAHMGYEDAYELLGRVEALRDESERVHLLNSERTQNRPAINAGTRIMPNQARRVKQNLSYVARDDKPADDLLEWNAARGPEYLRLLERAEKKIRAIRELQAEIEAARNAPVGE